MKEQLLSAVRFCIRTGAVDRIRHAAPICWSAIKAFAALSSSRAKDSIMRGSMGMSCHAGAAYSFIKLSVLAGKQGLTGLEFAGGIPGSVGGAVYMNAGAHGSDVSRIFKSS